MTKFNYKLETKIIASMAILFYLCIPYLLIIYPKTNESYAEVIKIWSSMISNDATLLYFFVWYIITGVTSTINSIFIVSNISINMIKIVMINIIAGLLCMFLSIYTGTGNSVYMNIFVLFGLLLNVPMLIIAMKSKRQT